MATANPNKLRDYYFTFELSYAGRAWQHHDLTRVRARDDGQAWETARRLIAQDFTDVNAAFKYRNLKLVKAYAPK